MVRRRRLPKFLSPQEAEALIAAAVEPAHRLLLLCGFYLGLRVSELTGLRADDVDFDQRLVYVRAGKGDKDRNLPMPAKLQAPLGEWLAGRRQGWLFPSPRKANSPLSCRYVQLMIRDLARACGLTKKVTPHVMRHSFATRLLHGGADLREVQELLGHASVATTQLYTWVLPERLRGAMDRL